MTDACGSTLARLPSLASLKIDNTPLSDGAIRELSESKGLAFLSLYGTRITDASVPHLSRIKSLRYVSIENTGITADGVRQLAKGLPQCTIKSQHGTFKPTEASPSELNSVEYDLLAMVDPQRNSVGPKWERDGLALVSPASSDVSKWPVVQIPFAPSANYHLEAVIERIEGNSSAHLILNVGGQQAFVVLDGAGATGLELKSGRYQDNKTTNKDFRLPAGQKKLVSAEVTPKSIRVTSGDDIILAWEGDPSDLALSAEEVLPDPKKLAIGSVSHRFKFHKLSLTPTQQNQSPWGLEFDGVDDLVSLPRFSQAWSQPFTWEAVVEVLPDKTPPSNDAIENADPPFRHYSPDGSFFHVIYQRESGLWSMIHSPDGPEKIRFLIVQKDLLGQRHHIAFVHTESDDRIFINGLSLPLNQGQKSQQMIDQFKNTRHPRAAEASLGEDVYVVKDTQRFFRGRIYQMRVTSGATYTENFAAPALLSRTEQTRLLYSFSEGTGDELKDSSGNNHHGKIIGAKWISTAADAR